MRLVGWAIACTLMHLGCAARAVPPAQVASGIAERTGADTAGWPDREPGSVPPGIDLADGVTVHEAVATALWNNQAFLLALSDLGLARADLIEAGLLRNPILSILFPWGPKQLEATANWSIDALWQRPKRLRTAQLDMEAVASRLVQDGVTLVASVRAAYVNAAAADRRSVLSDGQAQSVSRLAAIVEARFRAGEASELEARAARDDRLIAEASARGADHDRALAMVRFKALIGVPQRASLVLTPLEDLAVERCGALDELLRDALAARPDVRAAELSVEAAGARAGLALAQAATVTAILDANAEGKEGFELGPGVAVELPVFSRNSGGRARATAAFEQAQRRYLAVRARVDEEVHTAAAMLTRAHDLLTLWDGDALASAAIQQRQAEMAYEAGELPLLAVLDATRRIGVIRLGALDARREWLTAAAALDQALGRNCALK